MATAPKAAPKPAEKNEPKPLTYDEVKAIAGDLKAGEVGWVKLDDEGKPTGSASKNAPKAGDGGAYARVIGARPAKVEEATTPSGAPITAHMNPEPQLWDEGMLARNPVPGNPQEHKDKGPEGPYTVNTPATGPGTPTSAPASKK